MASNYNLKRSDLPKYVKWPDLKGFMQGLPGSDVLKYICNIEIWYNTSFILYYLHIFLGDIWDSLNRVISLNQGSLNQVSGLLTCLIS